METSRFTASSLPLMARNGHTEVVALCPFLGAERTSGNSAAMSESDPLRTLTCIRQHYCHTKSRFSEYLSRNVRSKPELTRSTG